MTPECDALLSAAEAKLRAADLLLTEELPDDAASRAYYAAFHAVSALHLAQGNAFSSHAQVIGRFNKEQFWPDMVGFKYKMSNIQAAIGCAQMERIDELIGRKREILAYYKEALADIDCIAMNPELPGTINGAWIRNLAWGRTAGQKLDHLDVDIG